VFERPEFWSFEQVAAFASLAKVWVSPLQPEWDDAAHEQAVSGVKAALRAGESYQVNLTFCLNGRAFAGSSDSAPWGWATALRLWLDLLAPGGDLSKGQGQNGAFAWFGPGNPLIVSLSPELFFERSAETVFAKPMKGTATRHAEANLDAQARDQLFQSPKERAENLMITDMIRNDLGRLAVAGSVQVPQLFSVEAYPTVWQLTSTVTARVPPTTSLADLFAALAPCASITGAPKLSTQRLIAELETQPRGWYTGTLGWSGPSNSHFNVLIRTLVFSDQGKPDFRLGVGGGIVWDSDAAREYAEALAKSRFLHSRQRDFDWLESVLWEPQTGFFLADLHRQRLLLSCRSWGEPDRPELASGAVWQRLLDEAVESVVASDPAQGHPLKVRVLLGLGGRFFTEAAPLDPQPDELTWVLAEEPLTDAELLFRQHKTTRRDVYTQAKLADADQTVFFNQRGELTESSSFNLVLDIGGELVTPALSSGLLAGTFRQHLLDRGMVHEAAIPVSALAKAEAVWFINSVRRWKKGKPLRPTLR
jgi:para-aminobenzoate synthetase/4-amino-4-deoxychorismate lyase